VATRVNGQRGTEIQISDTQGKPVVQIVSGDVSTPALSADGKRVAVRVASQGIKVWDTSTGKEVCSVAADEAGNSVGLLSFSADGKWIAGESEPGKLRLWDAESGKRLVEFAGTNFNVRNRAFSPDGKRLLISTASSAVRVFDTAKGTRLNND